MKLHTSLSQIEKLSSPISLMIGTFDGVHKGHTYLLKHLREKKGTTVVVTFANHPKSVILEDLLFPTLLSLEQKIQALRQCGYIDHLIVLPFTSELREMDYKEFIKVLHDAIGFTHLYRGEGDVLGKDRSGSIENIAKLAKVFRFSTHEVKKLQIDNEIVSTSVIKKALRANNFEKAKKLLDRPLTFCQLNPLIIPSGTYEVSIRYDDSQRAIKQEISLKSSVYTLDKPGTITIEKRI